MLFFLAANYQAEKIMTLNVNSCISSGDQERRLCMFVAVFLYIYV